MPTDDTVALALLALDARMTATEDATDEILAALIRSGMLPAGELPSPSRPSRVLPGQSPLPGL